VHLKNYKLTNHGQYHGDDDRAAALSLLLGLGNSLFLVRSLLISPGHQLLAIIVKGIVTSLLLHGLRLVVISPELPKWCLLLLRHVILFVHAVAFVVHHALPSLVMASKETVIEALEHSTFMSWHGKILLLSDLLLEILNAFDLVLHQVMEDAEGSHAVEGSTESSPRYAGLLAHLGDLSSCNEVEHDETSQEHADSHLDEYIVESEFMGGTFLRWSEVGNTGRAPRHIARLSDVSRVELCSVECADG